MAAVTEYLRQGGLNNIYFPQLWRLEVQDQGGTFSRCRRLLVPSHGRWGQGAEALFYKGTHPIHEGRGLTS